MTIKEFINVLCDDEQIRIIKGVEKRKTVFSGNVGELQEIENLLEIYNSKIYLVYPQNNKDNIVLHIMAY